MIKWEGVESGTVRGAGRTEFTMVKNVKELQYAY